MHAFIKSAIPGMILFLAGCASSPPVHFHTLSMADRPGIGNGAQPDLRYRIGTVNVPERLNRVDIVLSGAVTSRGRRAVDAAASSMDATGAGPTSPSAGGHSGRMPADGTSVMLLESDRWDAPFADALRDALATRLALASAASSRAGAPPVQLRLSLQVYRFDGSRAGDVDVLVDWRLRRLDASDDEAADEDGHAARQVLSCRYQGHERVSSGNVDALVAGMQRQVARLADDIVASTRPWLREEGAGCVQAPGGA